MTTSTLSSSPGCHAHRLDEVDRAHPSRWSDCPRTVGLLGPPGSGKGTQANLLSRDLGVPHVAVGDLFRQHIKGGTQLGQRIRQCMRLGELVPDDITDAIVHERLDQPDTADGFILDGFPRNLAQARALDQMLDLLRKPLSVVFYLGLSDERVIDRLAQRVICSNCQAPYHLTFRPPLRLDRCDTCQGELVYREDDRPEVVRQRLIVYHHETEPLIDYYRQSKLLIEIDAEEDFRQIGARKDR